MGLWAVVQHQQKEEKIAVMQEGHEFRPYARRWHSGFTDEVTDLKDGRPPPSDQS